MRLRDKTGHATSALLFSGPLCSGPAGFGMATIPLFALWLFVMRPGDRTRPAEDRKHPRTLAWPVPILDAQRVLVAFCLALGQAIGALFDFRPPLR